MPQIFGTIQDPGKKSAELEEVQEAPREKLADEATRVRIRDLVDLFLVALKVVKARYINDFQSSASGSSDSMQSQVVSMRSSISESWHITLRKVILIRVDLLQ